MEPMTIYILSNVWNPLNNGLKKKSFLKNWNNLKFLCHLTIIFFIFYFYHRPDYVDLKYFITLFSLWFTASTSPASELKKQALGRSNSVGIIENIHTKAIQSSPLAGEIHYGKRKQKLKKNCLEVWDWFLMKIAFLKAAIMLKPLCYATQWDVATWHVAIPVEDARYVLQCKTGSR